VQKIFEVPLEDLFQANSSDTPLPHVLESMLSILDAQGEYIEGIFRVSGSKTTIDQIKSAIDSGNAPNFDTILDSHTIPALFKLFLRGLPDPLIPYSHAANFLALVKLETITQQTAEVTRLLSALPPSHCYLMMRVLATCTKIVQAKAVTKMDASNIAIVLGPNILHPPLSESSDVAALGDSNSVLRILLDVYPFLPLQTLEDGSRRSTFVPALPTKFPQQQPPQEEEDQQQRATPPLEQQPPQQEEQQPQPQQPQPPQEEEKKQSQQEQQQQQPQQPQPQQQQAHPPAIVELKNEISTVVH